MHSWVLVPVGALIFNFVPENRVEEAGVEIEQHPDSYKTH